jgi:hypothetical protein
LYYERERVIAVNTVIIITQKYNCITIQSSDQRRTFNFKAIRTCKKGDNIKGIIKGGNMKFI